MGEESEADLVPLPGKHLVRRRFTGFAYVDQGDGRPWINIEMDLEVTEDGIVMHDVRLFGTEIPMPTDGPRLALDRQALASVDLARALDQAITYELLFNSETFDNSLRTSRPRDWAQILDSNWAVASSSVRAARRRRQVTPELLAQVLELYNRGGIEAVKKGLHFSESYSFKLLRQAREELSQ